MAVQETVPTAGFPMMHHISGLEGLYCLSSSLKLQVRCQSLCWQSVLCRLCHCLIVVFLILQILITMIYTTN